MTISTSFPGSAQPSRRSRILRRTAFIVAAVLTLIAILYIVEDWRGRRAWEQCQQELKAQGERLDWAAFMPARVPDDQNFIKTPLLEAVGYRGRVDTNVWRSLAEAGKGIVWDAWGDAQAGRKMDWARYQNALRRHPTDNLPPLPQIPADDALLGLRGIEPQLDELRAASLKPLAQFDIDRTAPFEEAPDFNFIAVRTLSQLLTIHAYAETALAHPDKAFADVRVIHRLSDGLKNETTLVALMIRVAVQGLALQPFWEGWTDGRWTDRELAQFQELFVQVDFLPEFGRVMRAERAGINALVEKYGIQRNELWRVTMRSEPAPKDWWAEIRRQTLKLAWKLVPRGWVYQNLVSYNHRIQAFIPPSLQSKPPTVSPAQMEQIKDRIEQKTPVGVYGVMSQMAIPNFARAIETVARTQTFVSQAGLVCALERCRKARGAYPESLAELAPQFIDHLPMDVITGKLMKYQRTKDDKFVLYSVGWNETDEGGTPALTRDSPAKPDFRKGDWVWRYPLDR